MTNRAHEWAGDARARVRRSNLILDCAMWAMLALFVLAIAFPARAQQAENPWAPAPQEARLIVPLRDHLRAPLERREFYGRSEYAGVQGMIERHVCASIGCEWAPVALRIARIESGFRCNARNRRAVGVFQNTDPARFGVSRSEALTCSGGVRAGVAHMAMCIRLGASSAASMMRCHNSGSPRGRVDRVYRLALAGR